MKKILMISVVGTLIINTALAQSYHELMRDIEQLPRVMTTITEWPREEKGISREARASEARVPRYKMIQGQQPGQQEQHIQHIRLLLDRIYNMERIIEQQRALISTYEQTVLQLSKDLQEARNNARR